MKRKIDKETEDILNELRLEMLNDIKKYNISIKELSTISNISYMRTYNFLKGITNSFQTWYFCYTALLKKIREVKYG